MNNWVPSRKKGDISAKDLLDWMNLTPAGRFSGAYACPKWEDKEWQMDWILERAGRLKVGKPLQVKVRSVAPAYFPQDLLLELRDEFHDGRRNRNGWLLKRFVFGLGFLYIWICKQGTFRLGLYIKDFSVLPRAYQAHGPRWHRDYPETRAANTTYDTFSLPVPLSELHAVLPPDIMVAIDRRAGVAYRFEGEFRRMAGMANKPDRIATDRSRRAASIQRRLAEDRQNDAPPERPSLFDG